MNDTEIIHALGADAASDEFKDSLLQNVHTVIELRVAGIIEDIMTESQAQEFSKRSQTDSPESVKKWVSESVVNTSELYESALADYIAEKQKNI